MSALTFTMLQVLKESFFLFLALAAGLYALKHLNLFYKLIFASVAWYALMYIGSWIVTTYQPSNHWFYNIYFPFECLLLTLAGAVFFNNTKVNIRLTTGYLVFLVAFFWQLASSNFRGFANYGVVAEALLLVIIYLVILYKRFKDPGFYWKTSPDFWLCLGIATYFACIVPYFSVINMLAKSDMELNQFLFYLINEVLANIRYLFTAISFWLVTRRSTSVIETRI